MPRTVASPSSAAGLAATAAAATLSSSALLIRLCLAFTLLLQLLSFASPGTATAAAADNDDGSPMTVPDDVLRNLPSPGDDFDIKTGKLLAPILIPRVSGTEGAVKTQEHFVRFFRDELPKWTQTWHNTTSKTPVTGDRDVPFSNLILRRDPPWATDGDVSRLTLVAHYDSKYAPEGFIGATDSAAPCAILMHVARSIDEALQRKWDKMEADGEGGAGLEEDIGVQILFLDGEEAFLHWTDEDSLYGARALSEHWDSQFHGVGSTFRTPLDSISLFVLLDLLGAPKPTVPSYFLPTHWAYRNMAKLEKRMRDLGALESKPDVPFLPEAGKKANSFMRSYIDDDHAPFMERGVDILHIIPTPFPLVWHNERGEPDDGEHLDIPTVRDWARITTAFVVEWMDIEDYMPKTGARPVKVAPSNAKRSETQPTTSRRTEL